MDNEGFPGESEQNAEVPFYAQPNIVERAQTDERLAQQLHGLELADRGRAISDQMHAEMERAVADYLRTNHPDLLPPPPEADQ